MVLRSRLSGLGGDLLAFMGVRGSSVSSSWVETDGEGVEAGVGVCEKLEQGTDLDRIIDL